MFSPPLGMAAWCEHSASHIKSSHESRNNVDQVEIGLQLLGDRMKQAVEITRFKLQ